jgi:hypothetical protein
MTQIVDVRCITEPTPIPELGGQVLNGGMVIVMVDPDGEVRVRLMSSAHGYERWRTRIEPHAGYEEWRRSHG